MPGVLASGPAQPNWDWVPSHYIWAPRGYVYVDGYWDYSIGRRGVLFAPVFFNGGLYTQPGFSYSPSTVINPAVFADNLFLRPQYQHYYFGDYYAANYQTEGFYRHIVQTPAPSGLLSDFAHKRWQHRQDASGNIDRRRLPAPAAPCGCPTGRTWDGTISLGVGACAARRARDRRWPRRSARCSKTRESPLRFEPVDRLERQKPAQHGQDVQ